MNKDKIRLSDEDLTYQVNKWQRYLYETERDQNNSLRLAESEGVSKHERYPDYQRELFSKLYNSETKKLEAIDEENEWASKLHDTASNMPEFQLLQSRCRGDEVLSAMGTSCLSKTICATSLAPSANTAKLKRVIEGYKQMLKQGLPVKDLLKQEEQKLKRALDHEKGKLSEIDPSSVRQAIRKGCEQAQKDISELENNLDAFSCGSESASPSHRQSMSDKRELAQLIKSSKKLKEIAKLAGRMKRIAANQQRKKESQTKSEVSSIEQGADIQRLLPSELQFALSDCEEHQFIFFSRFLNRQLLQYQLKSKEHEGKGPIIICCDESGSMARQKEYWSKAVALALLEVAQRQKRDWAFIHFSMKVTRIDTATTGKVDYKKLVECVEHFSDGGTNFEEPLIAAKNLIVKNEKLKKADIIFITDGCCDVPASFVERFKEFKTKHETSVHAVMIKADKQDTVKSFSDNLYFLQDFLPANTDEIENQLFSI